MDKVRSIAEASVAVKPWLTVAQGAPKIAHRLGIGGQRLGERLLLGRWERRDIQKLGQRRVPDQVGLVKQVRGVQGLQFADELGDLRRELGADEVQRHGRRQRLGLDLGRQAEDERPDTVHQSVDQGEILAGVEERAGQRRRDLLAEEGIKSRGGNFEDARRAGPTPRPASWLLCCCPVRAPRTRGPGACCFRRAH